MSASGEHNRAACRCCFPARLPCARTVPVMRIIGALLAAAVLTGCAGGTVEEPVQKNEPRLIAPVIITEVDTAISATFGRDRVVFDLENPAAWSAAVSPEGIVRYVPASSDGSFETNPSLDLLAPGVATVVLSGPNGMTRTHEITVNGQFPDDTVIGEDEAKASASFAANLIDLPEDLAIAAIEATGRSYRIAARDGEEYALTADYSTSRINLRIVDGIVTEAVVG